VPAVRAEAVEVTVENGVLTVAGERAGHERDSAERVHRQERRAGRFQRRFRLPEAADPDSVQARVVDGVLELTIGKHQAERPRRIEVNAA
jgi:HSP20 family protein